MLQVTCVLRILTTKLLGADFANRTAEETSAPIIVDISPPIKSDNPITIHGRHITSTSEIEAW